MVFLSYLFMYDNLINKAESVFAFGQAQIEFDHLESKTVLSGYALAVRSIIMHCYDAGSLQFIAMTALPKCLILKCYRK